jgi:hypothetical protein
MRPRWMSRVTLPVVLIAAAAAWPTGASASGGVAPPAPQVGMPYQHSAHVRHTAQPAEAPVPQEALIALGLLGMAGGTLLVATRTRRRTA